MLYVEGFDSNKSEYTRKLDELKVYTHTQHTTLTIC